MDLNILSLSDALAFTPTKRTHAIRIYSNYNHAELRNYKLVDSKFYLKIGEYVFDDIWPGLESEDKIMFTSKLASTILADFESIKDECESLMIHCSQGVNRGPAVAIALNDIYSLGHDSSQLEKKYSESNWFVYNMLIEVARTKNEK